MCLLPQTGLPWLTHITSNGLHSLMALTSWWYAHCAMQLCLCVL